MYVDQFDEYLNKLKSAWRENKLQSLQLQRKFLVALLSRHQRWIAERNNTEITRAHHMEIADLFRKILDQYDRLIDKSYQDDT